MSATETTSVHARFTLVVVVRAEVAAAIALVAAIPI
jgi:hypothetical protein